MRNNSDCIVFVSASVPRYTHIILSQFKTFLRYSELKKCQLKKIDVTIKICCKMSHSERF